LAALAASGLPTDHFLYLGYLPQKAGERRKAIEQVAALPYTLIWLESPHRLQEALADLQAVLGERQVAVAAELTKMYLSRQPGRSG
jgi:16S rRNA (cytidine1402-2'-O)-methyltransferase